MVKYKSIELPTVYNSNAEVVNNVMLVIKIGSQLQIFYESTTKILKLSDLTETERLSVEKYYDLDEKFYPSRSEIDKGIKCSLDQIKHCMFKCITGLMRQKDDLKWPEVEGRNRINEYIKTLEINKLILDVNKESATRE